VSSSGGRLPGGSLTVIPGCHFRVCYPPGEPGRRSLVLLGYEYLRGLGAPALLGFSLALLEGVPEFARLEFEDLDLPG
jgi:hypothetical protein